MDGSIRNDVRDSRCQLRRSDRSEFAQWPAWARRLSDPENCPGGALETDEGIPFGGTNEGLFRD